MGEAGEGAIHQHLERDLRVADPAHAVGEACGAKAVLPEQVSLATAAEHLVVGDAEVGDADLAVVAASGHGVDVADDLPALDGQVDEEGGVAGLRRVGVLVCASDEDGKVGALRAGDEPLVAVDHPVVAVLDSLRLDERRVGTGDLRFGHGEAGAGAAFGQRTQILLLLLRGGPVQERGHVAFVGGLGIDDEGTDACAAGLGGDERHRRRAQAHAVPLRRQVRVPEALRLRLLAQADYGADVFAAVGAVVLELLFGGADLCVHELADAEAHFLDVGRESKINGHSGDLASCNRLPAIVVAASRCCHGLGSHEEENSRGGCFVRRAGGNLHSRHQATADALGRDSRRGDAYSSL